MSDLKGKRVLLVEDEPIVAMMIEEMLAELGAETVGPAASLQQAMQMAEADAFDVAILDFNLNGERTGEVGRRLHSRGIPFIFMTGYGSVGDQGFGEAATLQKPCQFEEIVKALETALGD